jgi:hypothetical protein
MLVAQCMYMYMCPAHECWLHSVCTCTCVLLMNAATPVGCSAWSWRVCTCHSNMVYVHASNQTLCARDLEKCDVDMQQQWVNVGVQKGKCGGYVQCRVGRLHVKTCTVFVLYRSDCVALWFIQSQGS